MKSGALTYLRQAGGIDNPSCLALHPHKPYLYAVNEVGDFGGQASGAVSAFAIEPESGDLTFLNQQPTQGAGPCYLTVDQTGRYVLSANYGGGSVCVHPIQANGALGQATDFIQHEGSSVNPRRQQGPHAHSINLDPANRFAFAADLGLDKILIYRLDLDSGKLSPNKPAWVGVAPGAGPRHFDFHPNRRYAYVINEIGNTVTAFAYDEAAGALTEIQTISTLPDDFSATSHTADIHVAPSGKFLYGSNRGHNSIVIFAIAEESGALTLVGHEPTQGRTPRDFAIDPSGTYLFAANQDTDTVVTFRIDQQTGELKPTGHVLDAATPVCIRIVA
jgi:6-phosphogluconolactonase